MVEDVDNPEWNEDNTHPLDHAAKIKVARARLGMSQEAFAALLHIPASSLRNWEQRRTQPDAPAVTLIDLVYRDPQGIRERLEKQTASLL
jgi:DNA-binding transcriptional regulator YiaG